MGGNATTKLSEKWLDQELRKYIEQLGGDCIKMQYVYRAGFPDRLVLLPGGHIFFAEIKSEGCAPDKIQLWWHRKLQKLGFEVLVIDSIKTLEDAKVYASYLSVNS